MPYFLCATSLAPGRDVLLTGEEAEHLLKSRRLRAGERFALQDPSGARFLAELVRAERRQALVRPLAPLAIPPLPPLRLTLLLAAVKDKPLEFVLQKATELGVAGIVLFPSQYSAVPRSGLETPKAQARWERILREACKQCDRQFPPGLRAAPSLGAALQAAGSAGLRLALAPGAAGTLAAAAQGLAPGDCAALLVGPEGGFAAEELAQAEAAGYRPARLGRLILRTETAAVAACAVLLFGAEPLANPGHYEGTAT